MNVPKVLGLLLVAAQLSLIAQGQESRSTPIFKFETNEFWLNLHHFLYVLGRAENHARDAARAAVASAPDDATAGLVGLTEKERNSWADAVAAYAKGPSQKDLVFDEPLAALTGALAAAKDAKTPPSSEVRTALEQAAPIYRKVWWPKHEATNQAWLSSMRTLVDRHGQAVLRLITHAYGMEWPASGYPVHLSAYTNWAGAYSTSGNLLVVATKAGAGTKDLDGLEIVFHEAMHQWDDQMIQILREDARKIGKLLPPDLSHALIFFTAGDAVHRVAPEHVPYADAYGIWSRGLKRFQVPLQQVWKPYLDGHGTRDEALAALAALVAAESKQ